MVKLNKKIGMFCLGFTGQKEWQTLGTEEKKEVMRALRHL